MQDQNLWIDLIYFKAIKKKKKEPENSCNFFNIGMNLMVGWHKSNFTEGNFYLRPKS